MNGISSNAPKKKTTKRLLMTRNLLKPKKRNLLKPKRNLLKTRRNPLKMRRKLLRTRMRRTLLKSDVVEEEE